MPANMNQMAALIGRTTDDPEVVAFFMTQPATARRRKEGRTDLNGLRSLDSRADGYEVALRRTRIVTVVLYLQAKDGFSPFQGGLSADLVATDSRTVARQKLGPPTKSGADGSWDRFDSAACCLHVSYAASGDGVRMLTLMAPDTAP